MAVVSTSILREDIVLLRALAGVSPAEGFYIDVGANDPYTHSVTKLFYDLGWRGVNIEPSPFWFRRLQEERPRDINLCVAASNAPGAITFFDHPDGGLGTLVETYADRHNAQYAIPKAPRVVEAVTLADVCARHAPRTIHFMKIDIEGHEKEALEGMDFQTFRPWILCIEATEPMTTDEFTHGDWEPLLLAANYKFAHFDRLNRWYVASEHAQLEAFFAFGVDDYVHANDLDALAQARSRNKASEKFRGGAGEEPLNMRQMPDGRLADVVTCFLNPKGGFIENDIGGERFLRTLAGDPVYAIYGPYCRLRAGRYRATFDVRSLTEAVDPTQALAVLDVASESGSVILAARSLTGADLRQGEVYSLEFTLAEARVVEFRVGATGAAALLASENVALETTGETTDAPRRYSSWAGLFRPFTPRRFQQGSQNGVAPLSPKLERCARSTA